MKKWIAATGLICLLVTQHAVALSGDPAAGAQKALVCGACHGVDGNSVNPEWPRLASQHPGYVIAQLNLFKNGARTNPVMAPNAMALSEQDMADLAAYFAGQPLQGLEADPSLYQEGERLYRDGDAARELPACTACHGPQGKGNGAAGYPSLRAQQSVYLYGQLRAFADGTRKAAGNSMMQAIAPKLTDAEMRALASYLQGLR